MHNIHEIRSNPEKFRKHMCKRGSDYGSLVDTLLEVDQHFRELTTQLEGQQARRNHHATQMAQLAKTSETSASENIDQTREAMRTLRHSIEACQEALHKAQSQRENILLQLPNIADSDVPMGENEQDNAIQKVWGDPKKVANESVPQPQPHYEFAHSGDGIEHQGIDSTRASKLSGTRFTLLRGNIATLERALMAMMMDIHINEHGYTEVSPPLMVTANTLKGTGHLPKFAQDVFNTTDDRYLIPTAEVPLSSMIRDEVIEQRVLPLRYVAATPCFRSEAGAAGKDTRGLIRLHQFWKVELVSLVEQDKSHGELERMTQCAQTILERLDLPYQVTLLCAGDMGFGAQKTYDLEVWMAGHGMYREISSCSNCGPFQARRMNARYKSQSEKTSSGKQRLLHVHTLNGSALAVGRTMAALIERYPLDKGVIAIPEVLRPYLGGRKELIIAGSHSH